MLFLEKIPKEWLFDLLESICEQVDSHYCFNLHAYQKMMYYQKHVDFLEKIKPFYHEKKKFYVERNMNYNAFATIIRQICKHHEIFFCSKIVYDHSKHYMEYYIKQDKMANPSEWSGV